MSAEVLLCPDLRAGTLPRLLAPFSLQVREVPDGADIPGSYWGALEAGIRGRTLYVRGDTPVHSALHEACHLIYADAAGRSGLDTDADGTDVEESGVCHLQIVLAGHLPGVGSSRLMADMDAWGYSFRLGSTCARFEEDAEDARACLVENGLLTPKTSQPVAAEPEPTRRDWPGHPARPRAWFLPLFLAEPADGI